MNVSLELLAQTFSLTYTKSCSKSGKGNWATDAASSSGTLGQYISYWTYSSGELPRLAHGASHDRPIQTTFSPTYTKSCSKTGKENWATDTANRAFLLKCTPVVFGILPVGM